MINSNSTSQDKVELQIKEKWVVHITQWITWNFFSDQKI